MRTNKHDRSLKAHNREHLRERIDAYIAGQLDESEKEALWELLLREPDLLQYLKNAVNLRAVAERSSAQASRDSASVIHLWSARWRNAAAVMLLMISLVAIAVHFSSTPVSRPEPVSEIDPGTIRSTALAGDIFDRQLAEVSDLAAMNRHSEAFALLDELTFEELSVEQHVVLKVNKGVIHYNMGAYSEARHAFESALPAEGEDPLPFLTTEEIHWYLGNTWLKLQNEERALHHMQITYDLNGAYRRMAGRYLNR